MLRDVAFEARRRWTWSWPPPKRTLTADEALATLHEDARARAEGLLARYDTRPWEQCCNLDDWRESLYVLDLLSRWVPPVLRDGVCLDVGSKNGTYLPGLATAVPRSWRAVELDAHRRYLDGSTRQAYAEAMAAPFPGCRFVAGDVREQEGPWALVTWFLPFLTPGPLRAWGLPDRFLAPADLLRHVTERVAPGGLLLVVNQGEEEAEVQGRLFEGLGLTPRSLGPVRSLLSPFRQPRFGWAWERPRSR